MKIILFSVAQSETAPNTISLACCHISTFTLTILVRRLTAQLLTLPPHKSSRCPLTTPHAALSQLLTLPSHNSSRCPLTTLNTQISTIVQFFSSHIHSAVYSSLFSKFIEIQKTLKAQSWTLFVSPSSLAVPIIAACCDVKTPDRSVKTF